MATTHGRIYQFSERMFDGVQSFYRRTLQRVRRGISASC